MSSAAAAAAFFFVVPLAAAGCLRGTGTAEPQRPRATYDRPDRPRPSTRIICKVPAGLDLASRAAYFSKSLKQQLEDTVQISDGT